MPIADTRVKKRKVLLTGEIPSPSNPPKGCPFSTRCPYMIAGHLRRDPAADRRAVARPPHPLPSAARHADGDGAGDPMEARGAGGAALTLRMSDVVSRCFLRPRDRLRRRLACRARRRGDGARRATARPVLLVADSGLKPFGIVDRAAAALAAAGLPSPSMPRSPASRRRRRSRRRGSSANRRGAKAVVCLGGGSALDAGKLAAVHARLGCAGRRLPPRARSRCRRRACRSSASRPPPAPARR